MQPNFPEGSKVIEKQFFICLNSGNTCFQTIYQKMLFIQPKDGSLGLYKRTYDEHFIFLIAELRTIKGHGHEFKYNRKFCSSEGGKCN